MQTPGQRAPVCLGAEIGQLRPACIVVGGPGLKAVGLALSPVLGVGLGSRLFLCLGRSAAREKKRHQDQHRTAHGMNHARWTLVCQERHTIGTEPTKILI